MSGPLKRQCPVPLCGNAAKSGHLLCRRCWATVPVPTRHRVNRTLGRVRKGIRDRAPIAELKACARAYQEASAEAVAAAEASRP